MASSLQRPTPPLYLFRAYLAAAGLSSLKAYASIRPSLRGTHAPQRVVRCEGDHRERQVPKSWRPLDCPADSSRASSHDRGEARMVDSVARRPRPMACRVASGLCGASSTAWHNRRHSGPARQRLQGPSFGAALSFFQVSTRALGLVRNFKIEDHMAGSSGPRCGARTRSGRACAAKALAESGRCRNHGGLSTGPRTAAGLRRMIEAKKAWWSAWRAARNSRGATTP